MPFTEQDRASIEAIISRLQSSRRILFITGAGLSADSNLPTYRGVGGLYDRELTDEGVTIEEALSGGMMRRNPEISWKYISQIEAACREASHNRGHEVIAEMEAHFEGVWTLTQNVDGFHFSAGSTNVIDIHGSIKSLRCVQCHHRQDVTSLEGIELPPKCGHCHGLLRPDVVLFDEMLPINKVSLLERILNEGFDMLFSVGTSSLFPYIVEPIVNAKRMGVPTVEINPGHTTISRMVDHKITTGAAIALDAIWNGFKKLIRA